MIWYMRGIKDNWFRVSIHLFPVAQERGFPSPHVLGIQKGFIIQGWCKFVKSFSLRSSFLKNRFRLQRGGVLVIEGEQWTGYEGERMVSPRGRQRPGGAPHCRWDSPRSSTLLSTLHAVQSNWLLELSCILAHTGPILSLRHLTCLRVNVSWAIPCLGEWLEWGLRHSGNSQTLSSWPPGFQQPPLPPLWTWWKTESPVQSEHPYPVEGDPMVW